MTSKTLPVSGLLTHARPRTDHSLVGIEIHLHPHQRLVPASKALSCVKPPQTCHRQDGTGAIETEAYIEVNWTWGS